MRFSSYFTLAIRDVRQMLPPWSVLMPRPPRPPPPAGDGVTSRGRRHRRGGCWCCWWLAGKYTATSEETKTVKARRSSCLCRRGPRRGAEYPPTGRTLCKPFAW